MTYWKTEYAVADSEDGDEVAWFDDREAAEEEARSRASQRDGSGFRIIQIDRHYDERTAHELYVGNGDGTVDRFEDEELFDD